MPNVLLTTVSRPFGGRGEGDSVGAELFHAQVTRAQGIFSFRQVIRGWGLDYIAENIDAPAVVLHYPSEREFVRELKCRRYDYVGITFVVATFHKVRGMAALVRRHAPRAKIILGGYGTVLPDEVLAPCGDIICRGEGVAFMRELLGEDVTRPVRHPYAPIPSPRFYSIPLPTKVAHITGGLGCPNGCDFCCTSHFFKRQYVPFAKTGRELYDAVRLMERRAKEAGDDLSGFIIIDEDFFLHEKRAREFLHCVREGGRPLSLMGFGSVRGLSKFTPDEVVEMGFDILWMAFEGKEAGYGKLQGRPFEEIYSSLKARGVTILASMIIGFPYQDRETVLAEFEYLMSLGPTYTQFLIYFAFPGTPFHERVLAEGRYLPAYREDPDYRTFDGFSMHFAHPNFAPRELEALQRELYRRDFERLGPSIVRTLRLWFDAWRILRDDVNPLMRGRAGQMLSYVRRSVAGLYPALVFGPNRARRREARQLLRDVRREAGGLSAADLLFGSVAVVLAAWTWLTQKLNLFQQPRLLRTEHRIPEAGRSCGQRSPREAPEARPEMARY